MQIQLYSELNNQLAAIEKLGDWYTKSGIFRCTRVEQGRTIVVMCMTMNITPIEFLATYDLIDGVPRKKALACFADFRKRGGRCKWLTASNDKEKAIGQFTFEGETLEVIFTIEDARQQGLVKPNSAWAKSPSYMLRARVLTTAIGMLAPEVTAGTDDVPAESYAEDKRLELGSALQATQIEAPKSATTSSPVVDVKTEAEVEEEMGLRPASTPPPEATAKKTKTPAQNIEPETLLKPAPGPIPPPQPIEPEPAQEPPPPPVRTPTVKPGGLDQLDEQTVDAIGLVLRDHFIEAAQWMIKQGWIPPAVVELKSEAVAGHHLQTHLPNLPKAYAKRILTKKLAFMRAIQEINPE
jgi:hypothetical protein